MNKYTKLKCMLLISAALLARGSHAAQQPLSATTLVNLVYEQKVGAQVDSQLPFRDESGREVTLGAYFGRKPVILDLGYYECPMLCGLVLNGLIESLQSVNGSIGKDFEIVCVSISPSETPALARAKKQNYLRLYGRAGAAVGWHFLTGQEPAIRRLAKSVGFNYAYDPTVKQYAHPSGLVVLTPDGKVSKYFFGVSYSPHELQSALDSARVEKVGSPVKELFLLCCSFFPLVGKHSATILLLVRILGVLVLAGLVGYVVRSSCRPQKAALQTKSGEAAEP